MSFAKMHNMDWTDYRYFLEVARCGSLKAAAKKLKVNQSTVFRRIEGLEARIQVRLFDRHQTGYTLTAEGADIVEAVEQAEDLFQGVETRLKGREAQLSGVIKLSTSDTLGYFWLPPLLRQFSKAYPDIVVDIDITTRFRNLPKREADVVISAANRQPDTMIGRALADINFELYATKAYLSARLKPHSVADLNGHCMLLPNDTLRDLAVSKWLGKYVSTDQTVLLSDKLTGLYHYCLQGFGIAPLPSYIGDQDPRLISLFKAPAAVDSKVWILTHPELKHNARIKALMGFMRKHVAAQGAPSIPTP